MIMVMVTTDHDNAIARTGDGNAGSSLLWNGLHDRMAQIFCPSEMAHLSGQLGFDPLSVFHAKSRQRATEQWRSALAARAVHATPRSEVQ